MGNEKNRLAHTTWNCNYHIVFAPKYRRQIIYGELKVEIGKILRELCEWKGIRHHRTIPHARLGGRFAPQMRCKTLQYIKYPCGFAPFCGTNFCADPHALNDAVMP